MKTMKLLTMAVVIAVMTSCGLDTPSHGKARPSNSSTKTKVENVQINKEHSNAWAVTGMIRNNSSSNISGAVKIKFLNSRGDIVHNTRANVNDGDAIKPGQAGNFAYYTDPAKFDTVADFEVEFYEK